MSLKPLNLEETNTETGLTVLTNQNGEPTEVAIQEQKFDVAEYAQLIEQAKELKQKKRGASLVPKYHEFKTSVQMVEDNANQIKDVDKTKEAEKRQAYIDQNMPFTSTVGYFQGVREETVFKIETGETGEVKSEKRQIITEWVNEEGLFMNFGVQLAKVCAKLQKGTPIEIVFSHEEPAKNGGNVKIYEVYPLI